MRLSTVLNILAVSLALTAPAMADPWGVPEIGATGSLAGITAVAAFAAILRRRRDRS
ncbi:MAG: hypothetical protein WCD20_21140 [Rhodomicrobium sp.]